MNEENSVPKESGNVATYALNNGDCQPEVVARKMRNANVVMFSVKTGASCLLALKQSSDNVPNYLKFLQTVTILPSTNTVGILFMVKKAMNAANGDKLLQNAIRDCISDLHQGSTFTALDALRTKDRIAQLIRKLIQDPLKGYIFRKDHLVGEFYLGDIVVTPVGFGSLRAYREKDRMCTVLYSWGYGLVQVSYLMNRDKAFGIFNKKTRKNKQHKLQHNDQLPVHQCNIKTEPTIVESKHHQEEVLIKREHPLPSSETSENESVVLNLIRSIPPSFFRSNSSDLDRKRPRHY